MGFLVRLCQSSFYEDPSIETDFYPDLTRRADWVEYCETTIIKDEDEDKVKRTQNYPLGYRIIYDDNDFIYRLDFYVTKAEFKEAFLAIKPLGRKTRDASPARTETVIFGNVRIVLLEDRAFGHRTSARWK